MLGTESRILCMLRQEIVVQKNEITLLVLFLHFLYPISADSQFPGKNDPHLELGHSNEG